MMWELMPPHKRRGGNKPILVIVHQETSTPGRVGHMLHTLGYPLDIRRPRFGDPLPQSTGDFSGVVIFGGPMGANDPEDFIKREIDFIGVPLAEGTPFLGICLGAQMLAKHLGGEVWTHPYGHAEVGYYPLHVTEAGKKMMAWPHHVYQWHRDGFTVPTSATLLATGDIFPEQAFAYGQNAFGLQFHPELTLAMMNRWTTKASHRFVLPGAQGRKQHFEGRGLYDQQLKRWLAMFLKRWLAKKSESTVREALLGAGDFRSAIAADAGRL